MFDALLSKDDKFEKAAHLPSAACDQDISSMPGLSTPAQLLNPAALATATSSLQEKGGMQLAVSYCALAGRPLHGRHAVPLRYKVHGRKAEASSAPGQKEWVVELRGIGSVIQLIAAISCSDIDDQQRCKADIELHML